MIKTDNGIFYMTAGEACYIARTFENRLCNEWFGARIEPEDDIYSDEGGVAAEAELELGGKKAALEFKSFEISDKPTEEEFPTIRGGETLIAHLSDAKGAVEVDLLYTPYPRGGIARRAVVKNVTGKPVSVRIRLCVPARGTERRERNFIEITGDGTIGVCAVYGGKYDFALSGNVLKCGIAESVELKPGERFVSPEILCVHTDGEGDKAGRIFHDIVREYIIEKKYFGARRPLSLLCSGIKTGRGADTVAAAKQLGADSLVTDCGGGSKTAALTELAAECKAGGIRFGVAFDVSAYPDLDKAADGIKSVLEKTGADIVALRGFDRDGGYAYWQKAYALLRGVAKASTERTVSGACDLGSLCYTALCAEPDILTPMPPCARYGIVSGRLASPKTEFDIASLGCLCYALDVGELNDGVKRAVRAQVFSYQDDADIIMSGDLYTHFDKTCDIAVTVSKDKSSAYAVCRRGTGAAERIKLYGLDVHNLYHVRELDKTYSGAALRYVGVPLPSELCEGETLSLHLMQVVDYE